MLFESLKKEFKITIFNLSKSRLTQCSFLWFSRLYHCTILSFTRQRNNVSTYDTIFCRKKTICAFDIWQYI